MAHDTIRVKSFAKVNLCLYVGDIRPDGYHDIESVMQTVGLFDTITVKAVYKPNYLKVTTNARYLPTDERNIVYRAARFLLDQYRIPGGVYIDIQKAIPVSAGLGGGSSNCAAVLTALKQLFRLPITKETMAATGQSFGADVPFFFTRGTALAEGIGERITPLPPLPRCWFVLVRPPVAISTERVFKRYRPADAPTGCDMARMRRCLAEGDLAGVCGAFYNALETVTAADYPIIAELKALLLARGAYGALMSGSGATVFGCFPTKRLAREALYSVWKTFPSVTEGFVLSSI